MNSHVSQSVLIIDEILRPQTAVNLLMKLHILNKMKHLIKLGRLVFFSVARIWDMIHI